MLRGLIFPSASTVSLEIYESLINIKNISIIGVNSHDNYEYKNLFEKTFDNCPNINNNKNLTIEYLLNICLNNKCNFILPTMDYAHLVLSEFKELFNENNIKIISSSHLTNKICVSKEETYNKLKNIISCPTIFDIKNEINYPVFLKPKIGYGSRNCYLINNYLDLINYYNDDMLILEYLKDKEYTIDCFSAENKLLYFNIRERVLYKNGLSVITKTIIDNSVENNKIYNDIKNMALKINENINFEGAWFFQVKYNNDNCKLLEISTRIAGASSINRLNNVNLTLLSILYHFSFPINIINNCKEWTVNKIFNNYVSFKHFDNIENVYIDFDDTIIINSKINHKALMFIYLCINHNKNIYLITRHKDDIYLSLKKFKIDVSIFKEIIHIKDSKIKKSNFILDNSLFIDDSFSERKDCFEKKNILVFDSDLFNYVFI